MDERSMIDEAVSAAGGNYRAGLEAVQKKCMAPLLGQGLTDKAARQRCEKTYPLIFGRGRRPGSG
jgi:hypothetical protein